MASEACCTRPVAKADYTAKGEWIEVAGLKTYRTGASTASKAVIFIYDIFGFAPQSLQGADILAGVESEKGDVQVFIPDYLKGYHAQGAWFAPDAAAELVAEKAKFFSSIGNFKDHVEQTRTLVSAISEKYPSVKSFGAIGLCWGAKTVSLVSGPGTPLKAGAEVHPSRVEAKDALDITIPICILASNGEPADEIQKFFENLKTEKYVETFVDQHHGWMGARANLKDERNKEEYERGYGIVIDFFHKHL